MADTTAPAAPVEALANLHLDEVTGERVSKSELKKRVKQRQKDEAKAAKDAAAPPKAVVAKKSSDEADEKELNPNVRARYFVQTCASDTDNAVAILRDPIAQHQQTSPDQGPQPLPTQVPPELRSANLCR